MKYEGGSSALADIAPLFEIIFRGDLAIVGIEPHSHKRGARGQWIRCIGRRLSPYRPLYGLSLLIGHNTP